MTIGVPREIKSQENRVALLPYGAAWLSSQGHRVVIQSGAGCGAGVTDTEYTDAGAESVDSPAAVYAAADLIVKVKEPIEEEMQFFRRGQALFCYLHSETRPVLLDALLRQRITGIAYENVTAADGQLPLLTPMSIIAGQQAVLQGMQFLCNHRDGIGESLVRYAGLPPASVLILGGGHAGEHAARVAAGLGAEVFLLEIDIDRMRRLEALLPRNVHVMHTDSADLTMLLSRAIMVVHTTTIPADARTCLIRREMLASMRKGSIIVDVSANLRGAIETVDRYTTHADPVYTVDGILHYVVPNIPGTVARTASKALGMAVFPYLRLLAQRGVVPALRDSQALRAGLTCIDGQLTWHEAGSRLQRPWMTPDEALGSSTHDTRNRGVCDS